MSAPAAATAVPAWGPAPSRRRHLVLVPSGPEATPREAARVTLTRRGRLVVLTVLVGLVVALGWAVGGASAAPEGRTVVVEQGQTLSEIAATHLPGLSVQAGVVELQQQNRLATSHVHAGQELVIPTR